MRDDMQNRSCAQVSSLAVINAVASFRGVTRAELVGHRRNGRIIGPRFESYLMMREFTGLSLPDIGQRHGGRDHTAVMHGLQRIKARMAVQPDYADEVAILRQHIADLGAAVSGVETIIERARRVVAQPGTATAADAAALAIGLLTVGALLRRSDMSERAARMTALATINEMKGVTHV